MAKKDKLIGFVSAKGLVSNSDYLHFSAASLRTFGERYYKEFLKLENKNLKDNHDFSAPPKTNLKIFKIDQFH